MNVFEAVKQSVTTKQAAEQYGFSLSRYDKMICPFHSDRIPSMKVDKRFHCFGCGADGDVIDFTAKLYGFDAKSAAEKMAADFRIPYEQSDCLQPKKRSVSKKPEERRYCEMEEKCVRVLAYYDHLLRQWERNYAPQAAGEPWHPLFVEALQQRDRIGYLLDVLMCDPVEERATVVRDYEKEVMQLEQRLSELSTGTERELEDVGSEPALPNHRGSQETLGCER